MRFVRFESSLWATTSLMLVDGRRAVLVDPCISSAEVARIAAAAAEAGAEVTHLLITHADWDHISGIADFPNARALLSAPEAARIDDGSATERLAHYAAEAGMPYTGVPRCDGVLIPGQTVEVGGFHVEPILCPGHTPGGLAFRVRELGLLAVGDHLSPDEFPFASHSPAAYRATLAAFIDLLRRDPPEVVAPGHGPLQTADEALTLAEEDLDYLHALRRAAASALANGGTRSEAIEAAWAVAPPREATDDLAAERMENAERQADELIARPV
jgi:glyoxylase-like metal-dependent hydrolase (beta-lactamase superfamily II)